MIIMVNETSSVNDVSSVNEDQFRPMTFQPSGQHFHTCGIAANTQEIQSLHGSPAWKQILTQYG